MPEPTPSQQTQAMLAAVWSKNRDLLLHRLDSIDSFCRQLPGSTADEGMRGEAAADAHKLAGSLGMFGLAEGTAVAREIENLLKESDPNELLAAGIPSLANQLRALIELYQISVEVPLPEHRHRLLIVEGDIEVARGVSENAVKRGIETRVARNIEEARKALREDRFDVLVLDLSTADLTANSIGNGYADQVRELILSRAPMQVLALTSVDTFEDRVSAAQVGAHGYLPKNAQAAEIVDTCEHLLDLQGTHFKVLAVDDDLSVQSAIKVLLAQHSIRVTSLSDPRLFWNALEESSPDLVILNYEMPNFSGLELCRAIRNDSQWGRLPVLFLSVKNDAETVTSIFSAGADDFVPKPIIGVELTTRVRNRLERDRLYRSLSDYDQLTGVRNRRSSNVVIANYLRLAERHGLPVSVAILDLDKFKRVNDTYGHQAGDDVLQFLGGLLRQSFRSEDVVARWGGEEFVVAMFAMRRGDAIERLADVLERLEANEFEPSDGTRFRVSFSAGLAEFPAEGKDLHSLYRVADEALYRAKAAGGRRIYSKATVPSATASRTDVAIVSRHVAFSAPLRHALEMRGYSVELCQSKPDVMHALVGDDSGMDARVFLLDESSDSGFQELLHKLRSAPNEEQPAIFVLNAEASASEEPRIEGAEYFVKPYKASALMQRLRRVLSS